MEQIKYKEKGTENYIELPIDKVMKKGIIRYTIQIDGKLYVKA